MPQENTTWAVLEAGVERRTGQKHTFIIPRAYAHVITVPAAHYNGKAAVPHVEPVPPPASLTVEYHTLTGLLAEALRFAADHSDHKLLVAAHCEAGSSATHGLGLSEPRGNALHALLKGDRDAFIQGCGLRLGADVVRLLAWADVAHGYACTPMPGLRGGAPDMASALRAFRLAHEARFGQKLPEKLVFGDEELGAYYDLLELDLADKLEVEPAELASARARVTFLDPAVIACGKLWPGDVGANRVDLLFFEPDPPPPKLANDELPGRSVYESQKHVRRLAVELPSEPMAVCVRMTGVFFDTNKCFVLPSALPGLRKLVELYDSHPEGEMLVVGHTDATGDPSVNDPLSLERAKSVVAFLSDDVDAWLAYYDESKPEGQRWGGPEDRYMFGALPDGPQLRRQPNPVKGYQESRGLAVDGIVGPDTRRQLVTDYMALDGTTLPDGIVPVAHGCGENFPVPKGPTASDDPKAALAADRRVELFLFNEKVDPPPPGDNSAAGSTEYLAWQRQSIQRVDLSDQRVKSFRFSL